jgi:hypothetical protein
VRASQIAQRVALYPEEHRMKVASAQSLIDSRKNGGPGGGGSNAYYGKGDETTIKSMVNIANKTIADLSVKQLSGQGMTPVEKDAYLQALADAKIFGDELAKITASKQANVRGKYQGGGAGAGGAGTSSTRTPEAINKRGNQLIEMANKAIKAGKPRDAVIKKLDEELNKLGLKRQ